MISDRLKAYFHICINNLLSIVVSDLCFFFKCHGTKCSILQNSSLTCLFPSRNFCFPFLFNTFFLFLLFLYASSVRNCYLKVMRHCEVSDISNVIPTGSHQCINYPLSYFINLNRYFLRIHVMLYMNLLNVTNQLHFSNTN